jgi:hypothetical protein
MDLQKAMRHREVIQGAYERAYFTRRYPSSDLAKPHAAAAEVVARVRLEEAVRREERILEENGSFD